MLPQTALAAVRQRSGGQPPYLIGIPDSRRVLHTYTGPLNGSKKSGRCVPENARPVCGTRVTRLVVLADGSTVFRLGQHFSGRRLCAKCAARLSPPVAGQRITNRYATREDDLARFAGMTIGDIALSAWMANSADELQTCSYAITILELDREADRPFVHRMVNVSPSLTTFIRVHRDRLRGSPVANANARAAREHRQVVADEAARRAEDRARQRDPRSLLLRT